MATGSNRADVMRILFACPQEGCWGQMAAGFALSRKRPETEIVCGGCEHGGIHPAAVKVMAEVGIDISKAHCLSPAELRTTDVDLIVVPSGHEPQNGFFAAGYADVLRWNLLNPAAVRGEPETVLHAFREARDRIHRLVTDFFDCGYATAFAQARRKVHGVLNSISDGVIAHDLRRRILYFNDAAEQITGYRREEILGRDCRDVFPGHFCGGKCLFSEEGVVPEFEIVKQQVDLADKSGQRHTVEMSVRPMLDRHDERVGVVASFRDLTREITLARRVREIQQFSGIISRDPKMMEVFDLIKQLADTNVPVLIQGESGTGKELVAAAIHNEGPRASRLFVPVNCGALPESLLESELFGHVKGAFTGAIRDKKGRFELADGGTIFLDEIGDVTPAVQVKLLRVLQEGKFERVGSERTLKVDVRVISASHKTMTEEVARGRFRDDLFYRLSVVPVFLPPLRERRNDIPLLVEHFLQRLAADTGRAPVRISPEALDVMLSYAWPGNVRELQNWLQFALVKCRGDVIRAEHLPPVAGGQVPASGRPRRRKLDAESVRQALLRTNGNRVEAARALGVSRATLYRFLSEYGASL
jgi:PAS domain S-box-containing protein